MTSKVTSLNNKLMYMQAVALVGEFNAWHPKDEHWALRTEFGVYVLFLPDIDGKS